MAVYKDEKTNTWYSKFYYKDWKGERHQSTKRGFATKREAKQWEAEFKASKSQSLHISLRTFTNMYFEDKKNVLKERSIHNKKYMLERHVLPFFEGKKLDEITPADIIQWQNVMQNKGLSQTYLRMIQNQLTALFTHATRIYGLRDNPCTRVTKMGKSDAEHIEFWTKAEYDKFISVVDKDDKYYVLFELLFWCGVRIGEALALTLHDIDFDKNEIHISKTYYRLKGRDIITEPKTKTSVRVVTAPEFLMSEIKAYADRLYKYPTDARLFPVVAKAVENVFKRYIEKAGVKKIRIHDLRHSHASYLINQGVEPLLIKERLGHTDIRITLNTYGHLYPNRQRELGEMLNEKK